MSDNNQDVLFLPRIESEIPIDLNDYIIVMPPQAETGECERKPRVYRLDKLLELFDGNLTPEITPGSVTLDSLSTEVQRFIICAGQEIDDGSGSTPITPPVIPIPDPTLPSGVVVPTAPLEPNRVPGIPVEVIPQTPPQRDVLPPPSKDILSKIVRISATPRINPPSEVSAPVTTIPSNARGLSVIEKDRSLLFQFDEPLDDGGAEITNYYVAIHPSVDVINEADLNWIDIELSRSHLFTGLDNDVEYLVYVRPKNPIGFGYAQTILAQPTASAPSTGTVPAKIKPVGTLVYTFNPNTRKFIGKTLILNFDDNMTGLAREDFVTSDMVVVSLYDQRGHRITSAQGNTTPSTRYRVYAVPFTEDKISNPTFGDVTLQLPAGVAMSNDNRGNAESNLLTFKYKEYYEAIPPPAEDLIITTGNGELTVEWKKSDDPRIEGYVFTIRELAESFTVGEDDPRQFIYTAYGVSVPFGGLSLSGGAGEQVGDNKRRFVGLKNGTAYAIEVIPYNEFGKGDQSRNQPAIIVGVPTISPENLAVPEEALPSPMRNMASFMTGSGDFLVRWEAPLKPNFTGFRVRVNQDDWVVLGRDAREKTFDERGINTYEFQTINERGHSESIFIRDQFIGGVPPNLQGFRLVPGNRVIKVEFDEIPQPDDVDPNRFAYSNAFHAAFKIVGGEFEGNEDYVTSGIAGPHYFVNLQNGVEYDISGRVDMSHVAGGSGNNFPSPAGTLKATPSDSFAADNVPDEPTATVTASDGALAIAITPPTDQGGGHGVGQYDIEISPVPNDEHGNPKFSGLFHITKNLSSPSLTISGLQNGVEYTIKITAINFNGTFGQYVSLPRVEPLKSTVLEVTGTPTA